MSFLQRANSLIGEPYNKDTNHCYSLVMQLLPNAPKIEHVVNGIYASVNKINYEVKALKLKEVKEFQNEDIILLGRSTIYHHVGVYYDGGIIHADEDRGVVYDSMVQLKKFYPNMRGLRL